MAKYNLRLQAREMRRKGESLGVIAKKLGVAKSTLSLWVRDITLTVEQIEKLRKYVIEAGEVGRLKGALLHKNMRIEKQNRYKAEGLQKFSNISDNELFVAGIALYWAEGSKKHKSVQLCNSDPKMINFHLKWLKKFFGIDINRLSARISINEVHRDREQTVKEYWSKQTNIPLTQFRKTMFKSSKVRKVYENHNDHYGVFDVYILKPSEIYYKILGLIEGLSSRA
jgi:transcriptional regulator with XRE-family HTH domain